MDLLDAHFNMSVSVILIIDLWRNRQAGMERRGLNGALSWGRDDEGVRFKVSDVEINLTHFESHPEGLG